MKRNNRILSLIGFTLFSMVYVHGQINVNFDGDCICKNNAIIGNVILEKMGKDTLNILFNNQAVFNISFTLDSLGYVIDINKLAFHKNISDSFLQRIAFVLKETKPQFYLCGEIIPNETADKAYQLMKEWFFSKGSKTKNIIYGFPGCLRECAAKIQMKEQSKGIIITNFEAFVQAIKENTPNERDIKDNLNYWKYFLKK